MATQQSLLRSYDHRIEQFENADGGFPYYAGNGSRLESTAWASLAARCACPESPAGHGFFARCQQPDGLFVDPCAPYANFAAHALALLASSPLDRHRHASRVSVARAAEALLRAKGIKIPSERQYYQNNRLEAWSWCPGAFSWVEPTAWSLIALKKAAAASLVLPPMTLAARISDGERVLLNRACAAGGWNYGNANMYGRELRPHVPTTAVALLALQDRRTEPAVRRGLACLRRDRLAERTGMALALVAIALHVYGEAAADVRDLLPAAFASAAARSHVHVMAMVSYALAGTTDGYDALRF